MSNEVNKEAENKVEDQVTASETTDTKAAEVSVADKGSAETKSTENGDNQQGEAAAATPAVEKPAEEADESAQDAGGEMDFGAMLEQFEQDQVTYHAGELVTGKVVGISENGALVDFGYKSEGTVSLEEFTSDEGEVTIKQGDEVEVVIKSMGTGDAPPSLSRFDAERRKTWNEIEDAYNDDIAVTGKVTDKTKGGLKVDVKGVEAFLPGSQIDSRPVRNLDALIGEEIEAKVIKFSRKRNNIVLSRKVITDEVVNKLKAETLGRIEEGYIEEGTVKNLTDYGAFVDIGGIDGLLHVTDMSWGRLHNPADMFKVGESVQVKILKLDRDKEKVSLGFKQLLPDPWSTVTELYPVDSRIKGRVSSVTEYGAFVELEPGVEGLVHVSEMSWSKRLKHPKHLVKKGDEVEVQVLGIDPDERRISLGIKQLQANPWDTIAERFHVGTKIEGKVRNLTDFGAFVEVEEGVDGLVHVSDISWSKKIKHPKDVLKKGQEVEAVVTNIDVEGRRLSLSIKELTPSAWEQFTNEHKAGDVIKGTISRFASFGVFVELAPDLEGLCHISELSEDRIEDPEDDFEIGQELEFKILRIEHDVEKIGLSHRSVGRDDEPVMDSRSYSSEAKGGMASLGELANLNIGGSAGGDEVEGEETPATEEKDESKDETSDAVDSKDEAAKDDKPDAKDDAKSDDSKNEAAEADSKDEVKADEAKEEKAPAADADSKDEAKADEAKEDKAPAADADSKDEAKADKAPAEEAAEEKADEKAEDKAEESEAKADDSKADDAKSAEDDEAADEKAEEAAAKSGDDAKESAAESEQTEADEKSKEKGAES
ncbi:MAG: 30S ribosomal protein S1 [Pyrinomonadaceae bacterium]|nr:30S ribosomal protein S1 [Pyrinomonadaceae bacterium]